ncbi:doublesex- and mab-3-related transcription factor A2 isoform X2 [Eurosta solidaginis]|uniref:doublesex- and mab-3-related transcription factor A2 isoform X2 n=1 Tax=Eurosta solidaginis TaxID=178769 RepID=UPI0035313ECA
MAALTVLPFRRKGEQQQKKQKILLIAQFLEVALKRQQAVENAIALRLMATKTGKQIDTLPEGQIFGLSASSIDDGIATVGDVNGKQRQEHCTKPPKQIQHVAEDLSASNCGGGGGGSSSNEATSTSKISSTTPSPPIISQSAIDMLAQLFPHRKRSVLELILKRCDLDLLRAIESVTPSEGGTLMEVPTAVNSTTTLNSHGVSAATTTTPIRSAFKPVSAEVYAHKSGLTVGNTAAATATPTICAYPKWFVPLSFPVTMGHLSNLAPRCTLPNCTCMEAYHLN